MVAESARGPCAPVSPLSVGTDAIERGEYLVNAIVKINNHAFLFLSISVICRPIEICVVTPEV